MNIAIIYLILILLATLMTAMIIIGRQQRKLTECQALVELIASSPAVCYSCRQYGTQGADSPRGELVHVQGLKDHVFVEARLVYIPDELLR